MQSEFFLFKHLDPAVNFQGKFWGSFERFEQLHK